jgi:hypothetical protein
MGAESNAYALDSTFLDWVFLIEVFPADPLPADDELGCLVVGTAAVRMLNVSVVTGFAHGVWVVGLCPIATHEENIQLGKTR